MANKVNITVNVSDNGTISLTEKSIKKLQKSNKALGASVQENDRFWKGASQQSSNSSKNFSKLQQTISGGLVPAYATLAANIFAASAAFNFLKTAGDLRVLQEGQNAYAASTGQAMRTLSNDIIAATDSQIKFTDAAQGAAIATAAGIGTDQLIRLGKAAKDTSAILGRDVTDSFNRLIRGTTKAEPELLDELGIILRLKDASKLYSDQMGITGRELTSFERTQAVTNFVLTESERKYSEITKAVGITSNGFNKLGKSFDDLINDLKGFLQILEPVAGFLAQNPFASLLLTLPLLGPVFAPLVEGTRRFADGLQKQAEASKLAAAAASTTLRENIENTRFLAGNQKIISKVVAEANKELASFDFATKKASVGIKTLGKGLASELKPRTLTRLIKEAELGINSFATMSEKNKKLFISSARDILNAQVAASSSMVRSVRLYGVAAGDVALLTKQKFIAGFAAIKVAAVSTFTFISTAVTRILPIIGGAFLIFDLLPNSFKEATREFFGFNKALDEETKKSIERVKELNTQFEKFVKTQKLLSEQRNRGVATFGEEETLGAVGTQIEQRGPENIISNLQAALEQLNKGIVSSQKRIESLQKFSSRNPKEIGLIQTELLSARKNLEGLRSFDSSKFPDQFKPAVDEFNQLSAAFIELGVDSTAAGRKVIEIFKEIKASGKGLTKEASAELLQSLRVIKEIPAVLKNYKSTLNATKDELLSFGKSIDINTKSSRALVAVEDQLSVFLETTQKTGTVSAERAKEGLELAEQYATLFKLVKSEIGFIEGKLSLSTQALNISNNLASDRKTNLGLGREELSLATKEVQLRQAQLETSRKEQELRELPTRAEFSGANVNRRALEDAKRQAALEIEQSKAQEASIKRQLAQERASNVSSAKNNALQRESVFLATTRASVQDSVLEGLSKESSSLLNLADISQKIREEAENRAKIERESAAAGGLGDAERAALAISNLRTVQLEAQKMSLREQIVLVEELASIEFSSASQEGILAIQEKLIGLDLTPLLKKELSVRSKILANEIKSEKSVAVIGNRQKQILSLQEKRGKLQAEASSKTGEIQKGLLLQADAANAEITSLQRKNALEGISIAQTRLETEELRKQIDIRSQLASTTRDSLESSLQGGIAALIKNEESSLKDSILRVMEGVLTGLADKLSELLTKSITGILFQEESADTISIALDEGGILLSQRIRSALTGTTEAATIPEGKETSVLEKVGGESVESKPSSDTSVLEKIGGESVESKPSSDTIEETPNKLGQVFGDFGNRMLKIFSKENPLIASLGDIFGGLLGSLKDVFSNIFKGLGSGGGATAAGGTGGGLGGVFGTIISAFFASGGIAAGGLELLQMGVQLIDPPSEW